MTRRSSKFLIDAGIYGLFRTAVFPTHNHHKIVYECAATQQCRVESRGITRDHAEPHKIHVMNSVCPRSHVAVRFFRCWSVRKRPPACGFLRTWLLRSEEAASWRLLANVAGPFARGREPDIPPFSASLIRYPADLCKTRRTSASKTSIF